MCTPLTRAVTVVSDPSQRRFDLSQSAPGGLLEAEIELLLSKVARDVGRRTERGAFLGLTGAQPSFGLSERPQARSDSIAFVLQRGRQFAQRRR